MQFMSERSFPKEIARWLKREQVGVILTDTIYGLVAPALSKKAVERIYRLKGRDRKKPFIVLVSGDRDLKTFGIRLTGPEKKRLCAMWSARPTSIILPVPLKKFAYLHRGTNSIAFRMPGTKKGASLRRLLRSTGPLVAPSANPEGEQPAGSILEAEAYFGAKVDFYVDGGKKRGKPSRLVDITAEGPKTLRK